jgi:GST-like protein
VIDLHTWGTSNGRKASVMLEETGLAYRVFPIDLSKKEQHRPAYRGIHPDAKIPAIVDHQPPRGYPAPLTVFESGAILLYLAEKSGRLVPQDAAARSLCMQWLMLGVTAVGPLFAQNHWFKRHAPEKVPYAIQRYSEQTENLYRVLDARLADVPYLAGADYTIADIATLPWVARHEWQEVDLGRYAHVENWYARLLARPAVQRGFAVPAAA